jgi:hypothetical protein
MKRIAAILVLGGALTLGLTSQASASGDPLAIDQCGKPGCFPIVSVSALTGPALGDLICTPDSEIKLPAIADPTAPIYAPSGYQVVICKQ